MTTEQGLQRVRGVLRRRRLSVMITGGLVLLASLVLISSLHRQYRASAVLRALESQPAHEYVPPTVAEQVGERLKTLRLAVMARPILGEVADELGLANLYHRPREAIVDEMRARMEVKVEGEDTFLLTYEDDDAGRAEQVVNRIAERFIARQVARRERVAQATRSALGDEVARLRPALTGLENRVRSFKLAHYGSLPEQQEENLRTLDQTAMELNIQSTNADLEQEHRRQPPARAMSPMRHQEDQLATQLHEGLTRYTPGHPEVSRIRAELARVSALRLEDERRLRSNAESDPELMALDGQIRRTGALIVGLRRRQTEVRTRLAGTAKNGQELLALTTDLDAVRAKYQSAVGRLHDAELAMGVERGLRDLRYETVEGAARPLHAVRPNRPLYAAFALVAAALLALGVGFARDFGDRSLHTPEELAALGGEPADGLGAPPRAARSLDVLACVPDLGDSA